MVKDFTIDEEIIKTIYTDSLGESASKDNFYIKKEYSFYGNGYIFKISNFKSFFGRFIALFALSFLAFFKQGKI